MFIILFVISIFILFIYFASKSPESEDLNKYFNAENKQENEISEEENVNKNNINVALLHYMNMKK